MSSLSSLSNQLSGYLLKKEIAPGITVHVVSVGRNLMQCWVAMAKGTQLPVHSHPHEQSSFVMSGEVKWTVDGEERDGPAGSGIIFAPDQSHGALVVEDCVIIDTFTPLREDYLGSP